MEKYPKISATREQRRQASVAIGAAQLSQMLLLEEPVSSRLGLLGAVARFTDDTGISKLAPSLRSLDNHQAFVLAIVLLGISDTISINMFFLIIIIVYLLFTMFTITIIIVITVSSSSSSRGSSTPTQSQHAVRTAYCF